MSELKGTANIVSYEDHLVVPYDDGVGWDVIIRMELLTSLPARLKEAGMTEREVVSLGIDICTALDLCSRMHILHRDIKPQNVFLNKFGSFKLGDFGIARMQDHKTRSSVTGTPDYMAPEVYLNKPYDDKIDQYSLGLMMYWLLNERRLPFLPLPPAIETARERDEAFSRRIDGEPIPAPKNGSDALKAIVLKACNADPEKRFSSPAAMKNALLALGEVPEKTVLVPIGKNGPSASVKERKPETGSETIGAFSSFRPAENVKTERVEEEDRGQETIGAFSSFRPAADVRTERVEEEDRGQETIGAFTPVIPVRDPERKEPVPKPDPIPVPEPAESGNRPVQPAPPMPEKKPEAVPEKKPEAVSEKKYEAAPEKKPDPVSRKGNGAAEPAVTGEKKKKNLLIPTLIGAAVVIGIVLLLLLSRGCGKDEPPAERTVSGISIVSVPAKADYYVGEAIDLTGLTLNVRYDDGSEEIAASGFSYEPTELADVGTQKVTVTYEGKTVTFNVVVRTAELKEIQILSLPSKTEYFVGETMEPSGLTLKTIFENGESSTVGEGFSLEGAELTEAGTKTVTVVFGGKTVSFDVNVSESTVQSVSLKSMPAKTEYFVGESLIPEGLVLTAEYNDGTSKDVNDQFVFDPVTFQTAGEQTVTVTYEGKKTTFSVNVSEVTVVSVSIRKMPVKTSYFIDDYLKTDGLELSVKKSNGTSEVVTDGFECSPTSFTSAGTQTITVTFDEKKTTFDVSVISGELSYKSNGDGTCNVSGIGTLKDAARIVIPDRSPAGETVIGIGRWGLCNNDVLEEVILPPHLETIGKNAFFDDSVLKSVSFPDGLKRIDNAAFCSCPELKSVILPEGLESLGTGVFDTGRMISISIPSTLTELSSYSIGTNFNLKTITVASGNPVFRVVNGCLIKNGVLVLGTVDAVIPTDGSVHTIDGYAFNGRIGLKSVHVPASVTSIGEETFGYCEELKEITVDKDNPVYYSAGNCLIEKATKKLIHGCDGSVIPSDGSISEIGDYVFSCCKDLDGKSIPSGIVTIGNYAFYHSSFLTTLTIPSSVKSIGDYAFYECGQREAYYEGTKAQWNEIVKGTGLFGVDKCTVHCTDGEVDVIFE